MNYIDPTIATVLRPFGPGVQPSTPKLSQSEIDLLAALMMAQRAMSAALDGLLVGASPTTLYAALGAAHGETVRAIEKVSARSAA